MIPLVLIDRPLRPETSDEKAAAASVQHATLAGQLGEQGPFREASRKDTARAQALHKMVWKGAAPEEMERFLRILEERTSVSIQ